MNSKLILSTIIVIIVLLAISGIQEQQAYAFSGTISDKLSCEAAGGTWTAPNTCTITGIGIDFGETLAITSGIVLINSGTITINGGTISNFNQYF